MTEGATVRRYRVQDVEVPAMFYGTAWKEERTRDLTGLALRSGFRAIDTANQRRHYVEAAVGEAIAAAASEGGLAREALFLQTKFTYARGQDHRLPYDPRAPLGTQVAPSTATCSTAPRRGLASPGATVRSGGRWRSCSRVGE
jgi:aryl-alcohol dehydrogenase-like predicted oxidoreductase